MPNRQRSKRVHRGLRHQRVRAKILGTADRPRAAVYRSNNHVSVQLIDDENAVTILSFNDAIIDKKDKSGKTKVEIASIVGEIIGKEAVKKGIKELVFDRGGFQYHGRVRAVAEGIRQSGIKF